MNFDLRLPIGLMFTTFGLLLTGDGLLSGPAAYRRSLGLNVNLAWGAVILVFGGLMLWLALRARSAARNPPRGL